MSHEIYKSKKPKKITKYIPSFLQNKKHKNWNWDTKKNNYIKFYSTNRWVELRFLVKRLQPVCFCCYKVASEVHHIIPVDKDIELFYDIANLTALCEDCHKKVHSAYRRGIDINILFPEKERLKYNIEN